MDEEEIVTLIQSDEEEEELYGRGGGAESQPFLLPANSSASGTTVAGGGGGGGGWNKPKTKKQFIVRVNRGGGSSSGQASSSSRANLPRCGLKRALFFVLGGVFTVTLCFFALLSTLERNPNNLTFPSSVPVPSHSSRPVTKQNEHVKKNEEKEVGEGLAGSLPSRRRDNMISYHNITTNSNYRFNISANDVMVFLHIQKTGGTTFGKHLVKDLLLERSCECSKGWKHGRRKMLRCGCYRPGPGERIWLFSRYSTGWKCGLHPDWTELVSCVDPYLQGVEGASVSRRFFYVAFLRDPVSRYLSEYRHVQRGATWKTASHVCGGVSWADRMNKCYEDTSEDSDWSGVTIQEFMNCPDNLAVNRQTRMLADLELVGCYDKSAKTISATMSRDEILLASAKANLEQLAYFGLTENQTASQYLFESQFGLEFSVGFEQINQTHSAGTRERLTSSVLDRIRRINSLDIELYEFAAQLLNSRMQEAKAKDGNFDSHLSRLAALANGADTFNWADIEREEDEEDGEEEEEEDEENNESYHHHRQ